MLFYIFIALIAVLLFLSLSSKEGFKGKKKGKSKSISRKFKKVMKRIKKIAKPNLKKLCRIAARALSKKRMERKAKRDRDALRAKLAKEKLQAELRAAEEARLATQTKSLRLYTDTKVGAKDANPNAGLYSASVTQSFIDSEYERKKQLISTVNTEFEAAYNKTNLDFEQQILAHPDEMNGKCKNGLSCSKYFSYYQRDVNTSNFQNLYSKIISQLTKSS